MLPRLQSQESLLAYERVAAGTASLDPSAAAKLIAGWRAKAQPEGATTAPTRKASPADLRAMGIGVRAWTTHTADSAPTSTS